MIAMRSLKNENMHTSIVFSADEISIEFGLLGVYLILQLVFQSPPDPSAEAPAPRAVKAAT